MEWIETLYVTSTYFETVTLLLLQIAPWVVQQIMCYSHLFLTGVLQLSCRDHLSCHHHQLLALMLSAVIFLKSSTRMSKQCHGKCLLPLKMYDRFWECSLWRTYQSWSSNMDNLLQNAAAVGPLGSPFSVFLKNISQDKSRKNVVKK